MRTHGFCATFPNAPNQHVMTINAAMACGRPAHFRVAATMVETEAAERAHVPTYKPVLEEPNAFWNGAMK
jgi:hypothetical protein